MKALGFATVGVMAVGWWLSAAGCADEKPPMTDAASTSLAATGAGGASPCAGYFPDGFCAAYATVPEGCACADCAETALCTSKCTDDGKCELEAGEDCSCADCFFKHADCAPKSGFCIDNDDGVCATSENCTCKDCTNTEYCKSHCEDNGECVRYFEGCACADCKGLDACGGSASASTVAASSSSASSSSGAGGAGGAGAGGAGGA